MRWELLILSIFMLSFMPSAAATTTSRNCTGGYAWENTTWFFNGTEYPFDSEPIYCAYGCSDNGLDCAQPFSDSGLILAIGLVLSALAFLFAYLGKNLEIGGGKMAWPIQVMFMFMCLLFVVIDVGLLAGYSVFTENNMRAVLNIGYLMSILSLLIVLLFFFIVLFIKGTEWMTGGGKDEKD